MSHKVVYAVAGLLLAFSVWGIMTQSSQRSAEAAARSAVCAGPPLRTPEARANALAEGLDINRSYDCITRESSERAAAPQRTAAPVPPPTLAQARQAFRTRISLPGNGTPPLPQPPAALFVRSDYTNPQGHSLAAFVTPDPGDGRKHVALLWLTGGDTNSLDDFWTDGATGALRDAGLVVMFPTLRGGNSNPGGREYLYGEVDDVVAAAEHLARLPYVDASHLYLAGHSTGGTLALLTAEASGRFAGVVAFGPVAWAGRYHPGVIPVDFDAYGPQEERLRSPLLWLSGLASPAWVIEGSSEPSNLRDLEALCETPRERLHCLRVKGANHYDVVARVAPTLAARLSLAASGSRFVLRPEDFDAPAPASTRSPP